jgi:UDPglucose--hexose-1-phosphate uridylyltransferase
VFDNGFAALLPHTPQASVDLSGLLVARSESGLSRVVCFSPNHGLTIGRMDTPAIGKVVDTWVEQYTEIGSMPDIRYVQIFSRGEMMGCSILTRIVRSGRRRPCEQPSKDLRQGVVKRM